MMVPGFGIGEFLVILISAMFTLALPVGILFLLYKIYIHVRNIDEHLKKN